MGFTPRSGSVEWRPTLESEGGDENSVEKADLEILDIVPLALPISRVGVDRTLVRLSLVFRLWFKYAR